MKLKVKAKSKKGIIKGKVLIKHPMETGRRKDAAGNLIPFHHLTEVNIEQDGQNVLHVEVGGGVSKDPFIGFQMVGEKGDKFTVSAIDTKGETGKVDVVSK